jgi:hypothetical protein
MALISTVKSICLTADRFAFGDLLLKSTKSKQKCLLLVWPFLRQGSLTSTTLRGPAPKSRFASSGLAPYEDQEQEQITGFPAKAGPTDGMRGSVGPASAGKLLILLLMRIMSRHRRTRLGCRLNAGLAQWVEPHGCGESAVRTWMSVRRGPTERDRSEGIPTKEEPNQEQAPLVTWGAFPSNSPKAKQRPLGRRSGSRNTR